VSDSLKLFLIEDDDDVALLIRKSLERVDHRVTRCRTAADALIVLAQSTFDLILLDQMLPDMGGLDLLQKLASEGIAVPVLIITAYGNEALATRALRAGALDYIPKDPALTFLGELPKRVAESVHRYRLEQANQLLVQALESARDGVMITDLHGVIQTVNRSLEVMTGYTRQELVGQPAARVLESGGHPPEFYAQMWQTVLSRNGWQGELIIRRKDGAPRDTSMTVSPIEDAHRRLTHFVCILRDVTEHKDLQRQLMQAQKMQSVGTLAGGIAHEFNNLLAGINGYAALGLREPGVGATVREFLQNVVDLSERAAALTRQLLAFARKPALMRQRTNVLDLLRSTAELVTRTLHQEVLLDLPPADQLPAPLVEGDANQLQQALVNLALNARDAVLARDQAGQVDGRITFRLRHVVLSEERHGFPQRVPPGDWLLLEVGDHGTGMSREVLEQALDPFFTTKEVGQGTGLGLPMVFGIVQGHHGVLSIDTSPGCGTAVSLYLPRLTQGATVPVPMPMGEQEVMEPEQTPRRRILVIDDEEAVLDVVKRFLKIAGHEVTGLTSGREGVEWVASGNEPDLVILDVMMPREDTALTFHRIRQHCPEVPVLLCTGLTDADPAPQLLRLTKVGLIRKPFRMNELWYAVRQALEQ
jgi:PAS domain S-box-containing protein